jgi:hypothetical protein
MSKARQLADLGNVYDDGALSNRNLIINGAMQVAQRGTSFGSLGSRAYTLDRWNVDAGVTVQRADLSVDEISADTRLKYALQLLGNTSSQYFRQPIEDVTQFSSVTYTLSFWVKGSAATTLNNIYARQAFGSGGSAVVDTAFSPVSHSVTTSFTKYTGTVTLPSISGKTLGSGHHLELFMQVPNGTTIYITGVQLEVGDGPATPFEHRSYGDELARCQRYYRKVKARSAHGGFETTTNAVIYGQHPVTMRTSPTVTRLAQASLGTIQGSRVDNGSWYFTASSVDGWGVAFTCTSSVTTVGLPAGLQNDDVASLDAEL